MHNMYFYFEYIPVDFVLEIISDTSIHYINIPRPEMNIILTRLLLIHVQDIPHITLHTILKVSQFLKYNLPTKYELITGYKLHLTPFCIYEVNKRINIKLKKYDCEMSNCNFSDAKTNLKMSKIRLKKYENVLWFYKIDYKANLFEVSRKTKKAKNGETVIFNMRNLRDYEEIYLTLKHNFTIEEIEDETYMLFVIDKKTFFTGSLSKLLYELEYELKTRKFY